MPNNNKLAADTGSAKTLIIDFRKLLSLETDSDKQVMLRRLLVEEADKLSRKQAELNSALRAPQHEARFERVEITKSPHKSDDRGLLGVMEVVQALLENFHRRLLNEYPDSVKLQETIVGVCATLDEARQRAQQFADANPEAVVTVVDAEQGRSEFSLERE